jgi:hypothetical protein
MHNLQIKKVYNIGPRGGIHKNSYDNLAMIVKEESSLNLLIRPPSNKWIL